MTYIELAQAIEKMTDEQKQSTVTIRLADIDEYFPVNDMYSNPYDDVIGKDEPYLSIGDMKDEEADLW